MIKSSFVLLCTKVGGTYQEALKPLCNKILAINKLEFLHESCFFVLSCIAENLETNNEKISSKEKIKRLKKVFNYTFDIHEFLSFQIELKSLNALDQMMEETSDEKEDNDEICIKMIDEDGNVSNISDEIKNLLSTLIPKESINKKKKKSKKVKDSFVVRKIFNSSNCSTTLKTFDSEEEAEKFITEIAENYPEILDTCSFVIEDTNNPDILKVFKK